LSVNLTWRSFQEGAPLHHQTINLDSSGGTLGRATDNHFVIYDPEQFASRYHARIFIHQGAWYIEAMSSAGTMVNNDIELFKGQSHPLRHGDILSIGECEIDLQIIQQPQVNPQHLQEPAPNPWANQKVDQPVAAGSFNIDDFFSDGAPPPQEVIPQDPQTPEVIQPPNIPYMNTSDAILSPELSSDNNTDAIDDAFDFDNLFSPAPEPAQVEPTSQQAPQQAQQNQEPSSAPNTTDLDAQPITGKPIDDKPIDTKPGSNEDTVALRAFLKELNIAPQELIGQNKEDVMRVAGVILRTLTQGMMEVLQARSSVKSHFQMDTTQIQSARNNPLKFSVDSTDAMAHMLKQDKGYMDPIESAEEAVNDAKAHQMAMVSGLDAAIQSTIASFEPNQLEKEFNKEVGFTFSKKSKYWEHFHQKFKQIADEAESTSNSQFSEQFRQHYEAQIKTFYADKFK
jgi:type VI secretion system protein